jgi:hypothetical protein
MNRTKGIALISPLSVALLGGAVFGFGRAGSSSFGCSEEPVVGLAGLTSAVAEGRGTAAIVGDNIVLLEGLGNRSAYSTASAGNGVIRHATSTPGVGTAYVTDKKGSDTLVTVSPQGVAEIPASGEVTHPTLSASGELVWAEDFRALKVSSADGRLLKTIAPPKGSTAIFSPLFTRPNELIAVVQEPVEGDSGEDDSLNNLFRYDIGSDTWSRLTAFRATGENWSVLRTPVLAQDGAVYFVRLRAMASETRPPSFELWSLRGKAVAKVRDLPKEMYLAEVNDRGLLWNIYDGTDWRLFLESGSGLVDLGCGAVMVDPRAQPDPDIPREDPTVDRRRSRQESGAPNTSASLASGEMAILVGDFSSPQGAEAVASRLRIPGVTIVDHRTAPLAIAPGAWGVATRLPVDADLTLALDEFRRRFPDYTERTWIVSLAGGTSLG